jgi:hypothetical protein
MRCCHGTEHGFPAGALPSRSATILATISGDPPALFDRMIFIGPVG